MRIALPCPGLGRTRRGYERFTADLACALDGHAEVAVFAGRRPDGVRARVLPCLARDWLVRAGVEPHRAYYWEQVTFGASLWPALAAWRPDVVHLSDPTLANVYRRLRHALPGRPPFVFCNSGGISPEHWPRDAHVQLVHPAQAEAALAAGADAARCSVLPLGTDPARSRPPCGRAEARARLGLPRDGLIALCVASLDRSVKRLDYLIEEIARPENAEWHLVATGQPTAETAALLALGERLLPGRCALRAAPTREVPLYLAAADVFVLASHGEGFGLALLEAMAAGLPAVVRDLPSLRHILDDPGQLAPLAAAGDLGRALRAARDAGWRARTGLRNAVRAESFAWPTLVPRYLALYERVRADARG